MTDRSVDVNVRVGVADDQPLIRTGLRTMIDHAPDLELVGEAANGEQAVELARRHRPDVVLMDIRMPELDGIEATRRITADAALTGVRVIVLTTFDVDEYVHAAIRAGASGFLLKDAAPEDVLDAIRVVARGDALLAPSVTRRIIEELAARPDPDRAAPPQLDVLTDREREVLTLVGRGLSNAEIGAQIYVSPATAKTHVSHVMTKLYARDRAQLVVVAYESGLVRPGE
ncbi:MAG: response regulator [Acidimicrobiia bacterium]